MEMEQNENIVVQIENSIKNSKTYKSMVNGIVTSIKDISEKHHTDLKPSVLLHLINTTAFDRKHKDITDLRYDILKDILLWQCAYYDLNDNIEVNLKELYSKLLCYHIKCYEAIIDLFKQLEVVTIPFNFRLSNPMNESISDAKQFIDSTAIIIKVMYGLLEEGVRESGEKGIMPLFVFHKDVIGNEASWEKTLKHWTLCYLLYKTHFKEGMSKTQIVKEFINISSVSKYSFNENDIPNSIHRLNILLEEARQLVISAQNGTFPI
jgi:hypothetical protein